MIGNEEPVMDPKEPKRASAEEIIEKARVSTQRALKDAGLVLGYLFSDPMAAHKRALGEFSKESLMYVGLIFSLAFVLFQALAVKDLFVLILGVMDSNVYRSPDGINFLQLFIMGLVPLGALFLSFLGLGAMLWKKAEPKLALYASGVTLFPATLTFVLYLLLGVGGAVFLLGFFCACYGILLAYGVLYDVYGLGSRLAFFATPVLFGVSGYLTRLFYGLTA